MLYYFFRFLEQYDIPGSHMWSYISFRALLTLILALLISAWFGERFIKWMKRRKIYETERDPSIDASSSSSASSCRCCCSAVSETSISS